MGITLAEDLNALLFSVKRREFCRICFFFLSRSVMVVMTLWLDMRHPLRSFVGGGFMLNHKIN